MLLQKKKKKKLDKQLLLAGIQALQFLAESLRVYTAFVFTRCGSTQN